MSRGFWDYREEDEDKSGDDAQPAADNQHVDHYEEIAVNCYHHPDRRATSICPRCQIYYCSECLTLRKGKLICKTCYEVEHSVTDDQIFQQQEASLEDQIKPERPPDFNPYGTTSFAEGGYANPIVRFIAYVLDLAIARIFYFVLYFFAAFVYISVQGKFTIFDFGNMIKAYWPALIYFKPWYVFLLADFLYFFIQLSIKNRTFGMSWLNLRIVTIYGDFAGLSSVLIRTLIMVLTLNVTVFFAFFNTRRQALHDWLAQTAVINYSGIKDIDPYETISIEM